MRDAQARTSGAHACRTEHARLAFILVKLGRTADAEDVIASASSLETGPGDAYDGLAFVCMQLGQHELANRFYRRAIEIAPQDGRFWYNMACSERSFGRLIEAEAACDRAIAIDATHYASHLLRSELRVQTESANHVAELQARLRSCPGDYRARVFLGYALAKELDDLQRFDEAFHWFSSAARARRERLDYDVAADEHKLRRIAVVYDERHLKAHAKRRAEASGEGSTPGFVFIVGLPRSGTTLVERVLSGLPGVRSNGETDNFSQALLSAARGDGDIFARAARADSTAVAAEYARLVRPGAEAHTLVEKLPLNYLYAGAIRCALPQAKIVLVSRDARDSCFAMYRTLFAGGYPFSYDLTELGRYYRAYERLMDHWRANLGSDLHEIRYHELVQRPKQVGAALAAHCELAWNDSAVEIQHNAAVSLTASASQIRRPIYGSSSGRWRNYEKHLGALLSALEARDMA